MGTFTVYIQTAPPKPTWKRLSVYLGVNNQEHLETLRGQAEWDTPPPPILSLSFACWTGGEQLRSPSHRTAMYWRLTTPECQGQPLMWETRTDLFSLAYLKHVGLCRKATNPGTQQSLSKLFFPEAGHRGPKYG